MRVDRVAGTILVLLLGACACREERPATTAPAPATSAAPVLPGGAAAPPGPGVRPARRARPRSVMRIHVDIGDLELALAMDLIGRHVGTNILVDPIVQEAVTVAPREVPWRERGRGPQRAHDGLRDRGAVGRWRIGVP